MYSEEISTLTQNSELPSLSLDQIEFLKCFVRLEARIENIRDVLAGIFDFDFGVGLGL